MDATALLRQLHSAGVEVSVSEGRIALDGPAGAVSDELVALVRENKPELVAIVEAARPLGTNGCETHGTSGEDVVRWWEIADEREADVSVCPCCCGPAPLASLTCLRCQPLTVDLIEALQTPPPCRCGAPGTRCDAERGWLCDACA